MKTRLLFLMLFIGIFSISEAQVSINQEGNDPHESAMLDVSSSDKGLLIPRMSTNQREAIENPANGLMVFDLSSNSFWFYSTTTNQWAEMGGAVVNVLNDLLDARTDANSVYIGYQSGQSNEGNNSNTALGTKSLKDNISGTKNTAVGYISLSNTTTGDENVALGYSALGASVSGNKNTAVGYAAGSSIGEDASGNVFLGYEAGKLEDGSNKLYIENSNSQSPLIGGDFSTDEVIINGQLQVTDQLMAEEDIQAMANMTVNQNLSTTSLQVTGGEPAEGKVLTSDDNGNAIWQEVDSGAEFLNDLTDAKTDDNSMFIGSESGISDEGNNFNTAVGIKSLKDNTTGSSNVALGSVSLTKNTEGSENTSIGFGALSQNKTGSNNTAVGFGANGYFNVSGENNVAIGNKSLLLSSGSNNTAVGAGAGQNSSGTSSGNVFIGFEAGKEEDGSNKLYIENSASSSPLIKGDFDTDEVEINGSLEVNGILRINSGNPAEGKVLTSDAQGNASWTDAGSGVSEINDLSDAKYENESLYFGTHAGYSNNAENNIAIGSMAMSNNINSTGNIAIGKMAGYTINQEETHGNILIGHYAGAYNTYNNQLIIDNDNSATPFIQGDMTNNILTINGVMRIMGGNPGSGKILSSGYDNRSEWIDPVWATEINGLTDAKADDTNIYFGQNSGENSNENTYNNAIGHLALTNNTNGTFNAAFGYGALENNTSGSSNIAIGHNTMESLIGGSKNTAIGKEALRFNNNGEKNTAIGYNAGRNTSNNNATGNIFIGYMAGYNEGSDNKLYIENSSSSTPLIGGDFETDEVVINGTLQITGGNPGAGRVLVSDANGKASWSSTSGVSKIDDLTDAKNDNSSIYLGSIGGADDGNNKNTSTGIQSLSANTSGQYNAAFGNKSLYANTEGSSNSAFGYGAMELSTTGNENTALGSGALYYNGSGSQNTAIGFEAGFGSYDYNSTGNVFLGYKAGYNETGSNKLYIDNSDTDYPLIYGDFNQNKLEINGELKITGGDPAEGKILTSDASGNASWQSISSTISLDDLEDASENGNGLFIGSGSGENAEEQTYNLAVGKRALSEVTSGQFNVAMGPRALFENQTGSLNAAFGYKALENSLGDGNIAFGAHSGQFSNTTNSIFIGKDAGRYSSKDNALYIDNTSTESPLIEGDFSDDKLTVNGELIVENGITVNDDVVIQDDYKYKSNKTGYLNVAGLDFKISQYGNYDSYSTYVTYPAGAISVWQYNENNIAIDAPVKLPKGVTIKSFTIHYQGELNTTFSFSLKSRSLIDYAENWLGYENTTINNSDINVKTISVNNIVVNESSLYFLAITATPQLNNNSNSDTRVYAVTIEYEYDTLNY